MIRSPGRPRSEKRYVLITIYADAEDLAIFDQLMLKRGSNRSEGIRFLMQKSVMDNIYEKQSTAISVPSGSQNEGGVDTDPSLIYQSKYYPGMKFANDLPRKVIDNAYAKRHNLPLEK